MNEKSLSFLWQTVKDKDGESYRILLEIAYDLLRSGVRVLPAQPDSNDYYKETPAVTKYNLNVDYQFHPNLRFFIQAQNFTNNITPDWDKSYPVSGASWMFGLNMNFNKTTK